MKGKYTPKHVTYAAKETKRNKGCGGKKVITVVVCAALAIGMTQGNSIALADMSEAYAPKIKYVTVQDGEQLLQEENYVIHYTLSEGSKGRLSFDTVELEMGSRIGEDHIPSISLPEGWVLVGYIIDGELFTEEQLADYVPVAETEIQFSSTKLPESPKPEAEATETPAPISEDENTAVDEAVAVPDTTLASSPDATADPVATPAPDAPDATEDPTATPAPDAPDAAEDPTATPSPDATEDADETATYFAIRYTLGQDIAGELSFVESEVKQGEKIGADKVPSLALADGTTGTPLFTVGEKTYSAVELAELIPESELDITVSDTVTPEEGKFVARYVMAAGAEGSVAFDAVEIPVGSKIGAENIPGVILPEDWKLVGYMIGENAYTLEELAEYVPAADTEITILSVAKYEVIDGEIVFENDIDGDASYWEYPPAWVGAHPSFVRGNLPLTIQMQELDAQLEKEVGRFGSDAEVRRDSDNICDVLAVYAMVTGSAEDFPYSIRIESESDVKTLNSIYWYMNRVVAFANANEKIVRVKRISAADAAGNYGLNADELAALASDGNAGIVAALESNSILDTLSEEEYALIQARIPSDTSSERQAVLLSALSLEGKVGYFWGGKSYNTGWDDRWGELRTVTGDTDDAGSVRPLGLDCSGFVTWAFINAGGSRDMISYIGNGSASQYKNSFAIEWNEAQPGDLVFYKTPTADGTNHVGIVLTVNANGEPESVIHCAPSGGVIVTGADGFKMVRRPYLYK